MVTREEFLKSAEFKLLESLIIAHGHRRFFRTGWWLKLGKMIVHRDPTDMGGYLWTYRIKTGIFFTKDITLIEGPWWGYLRDQVPQLKEKLSAKKQKELNSLAQGFEQSVQKEQNESRFSRLLKP